MKKLIWMLVLAGSLFSCQLQEAELPVNEEVLAQQLMQAEAERNRNGNNGPEVIPSGVEACAKASYDLFAGRHDDVGSVTLANDAENLYITYFTTKSFGKLHLWYGKSLAELPVNPAGNPVIGHFPLKANAPGKKQYTFTIPLSKLEEKGILCDQDLVVVAHAEVGRESAFGGTTQIPGCKRWAYYMTYTLGCCDDEEENDDNPIPGEGREVAFAKGNWVFVDDGCSAVNPECLSGLGIANVRWGWAINVTGPIGRSYDIWASATGNDTSVGKKIGRLEVETTTWNINGVPTGIGSLTVILNDGWVMESLNIYAGDLAPASADPSTYGHTYTFPAGTYVHTHTINFVNNDVAGDGVWFIANAIVRPSNL